MLFVNLPLRYILEDSRYLQLLLAHTASKESADAAGPRLGPELGPELGLDARVLEQDRSWFEGLAQRLRQESVCCTVHLPFIDLRPGSPDRFIREASQRRLEMALDIASLFSPQRLIAHPHYFGGVNGHDPQAWLDNSAAAWSALIDKLPPGAVLCLENTHETEPGQLLALASRLDPEKSGICFDAGHWFSFAKGWKRRNLDFWLETLAPRIKHMHLHDNDGSHDQHKGLGHGDIPWDQLLALLQRLDLRPSATLEPHCEESFLQSLEFLRDRPQFCAQFATPGRCRG